MHTPNHTPAAGLETECRFLKGVGPRRAESLERLGIRTVGDLLLHAPRTYFDRSHVHHIAQLRAGMDACLRVRLESLHARTGRGGRRAFVQATVSDDTGSLHVVWYTPYVADVLQPGNQVMLAGPVLPGRGRLELRQPEFERIDHADQELLHGERVVPLYPSTRGVSQKWLRGLMQRALDAYADAAVEFVPAQAFPGLPRRGGALRALHFPDDAAAAESARRRFKVEELFMLQLLLARQRARAQAGIPAARMAPRRDLQGRYLAALPFRLTAAQQRVLGEINADLGSGRWMQRLVQGDVGSGKTVLAMAALLQAVDSGYQGALMAPTEALAQQHAERFVAACAALDVRLGVLVGSRSERDKQALRGRMASGDVDVVIGTHALIQEGVGWARLGLAVVDEQQRFGVLQRGALQREDASGRTEVRPHVLVLSATPIPRSLALTLFGDLDVSQLDEKPPGRQRVGTHLVPAARRADLWAFVRAELQAGRQAYVVLPLIDESENMDLRAATEEYEHLRDGPLRGARVGLLHGRLPATEKEELLRAFHAGRVQLLVTTTVVEVGIDVANATLMIVHHPDRFGLAQLHQLRGRVGRSAAQAYCFLLADEHDTAALHRLREFARTDDGFAIAELDLQLRGPGDFIGTRQHGLPTLRFADLRRDADLVEETRRVAHRIVAADPELERVEHAGLRAHLAAFSRDRATLAEIG